MKPKANFLRMLIVLIISFFWGGTLSLHAEKKAWAKFDSEAKTFTFYYTEKGSMSTNEFEVINNVMKCSWEAYTNVVQNTTKVIFDQSFSSARPQSCAYWFYNFENLETIEGLKNLNTSNAESIRYMFANCVSLEGTLDLTTFNTQKVTDMSYMFYRCLNLKTLDLSSFNTKNVRFFHNMFCYCNALKTIYASNNFITSQISAGDPYVHWMFHGCYSLQGDIAFNDVSISDNTYAKLDGGFFTDKNNPPCPWVNYADGVLTFNYGRKEAVDNKNTFFLNTGMKENPGWLSLNSQIKKVVFNRGFALVHPVSCYKWFNGCNELTEIVDLKYLNTSECQTMQDMFCVCPKLTSLDVSTFNTEKCENMAGMFNQCKKITSLNLKNFNTSKVTKMHWMFYGCDTLKTVDLSSFDTQQVDDISYMFSQCYNLTNVDLSSFNTQSVNNMRDLFSGCNNLENVNLSSFNTQSVNNMRGVFYGCNKLKSIDLSSFNTQNVTNTSYMFDGCNNLETIYATEKFTTDNVAYSNGMFNSCNALVGDIKWISSNATNKTYAKLDGGYFKDKNVTNRPWVKYDDGVLTFQYGYKYRLDTNEYELNKDDNDPGWTSYRNSVKKVVFDKSFTQARPTSCYRWFWEFKQLTDDNLIGLKYLNTSETTNMYEMFDSCQKLTTLDLSNFNTAKCQVMAYMFWDDINLKTIYVSEMFTTANVTDHKSMFYNCKALEGDIKWNKNYTDKTYAKLDGGYFKDKNVTNRPWVKYDDGVLTFQYGYKYRLDTNEYELNEAWDRPAWNSVGASVTKVVFDKSFAEARPTSCYSWFSYLSNLTTIEGIENLNTSETTVMNSMFYVCEKLKTLDLSNFDTQKVTNMNYMFSNCLSLKSLYVSDMFVVPSGNNLPLKSSVKIYCKPSHYNTIKEISEFADNTIKSYAPINAKSEYGTLCVPVGSNLEDGSFTGFDKLYKVDKVDSDKSYVTMVEVESIEPGVPYIYHRNLPADATRSEITFSVNSDAAVTAPKNESSLLKGTFETMIAPSGSYLLQSDGKFHPVPVGNTTIGLAEYRAYLDLSSLEGNNAKALKMVFEDKETTGVNGISDQVDTMPMVYFDLMGRRVASPKRGDIYIVNGKKVVYAK